MVGQVDLSDDARHSNRLREFPGHIHGRTGSSSFQTRKAKQNRAALSSWRHKTFCVEQLNQAVRVDLGRPAIVN